MKKLILSLLLAATASAYADFTVILDAGRLRIDSATPMVPGSLIFLFAAGGDGTFSNTLAAGQYVSGNDILLAVAGDPTTGASAFNTSGGPDETVNTINVSTTNFPTLAPGDLLALRWFPNITFAEFQAGATPEAGDLFGTYNPLFWGNATNFPDDGNAWAVPAPGGLINLNFFTTDSAGGGTQDPTTGYAQFVVVPESSTYALLAVGGVIALLARRRRAA